MSSSGTGSLFGSLPDRPPSSNQSSKDFDYKNHQDQFRKKVNKINKNNKSGEIKSLTQLNKNQKYVLDSDPTNCIMMAIQQARNNSKHLRPPQNYEYYGKMKENMTDPNYQKLRRQIINNQIDSKHEERLRQKSMKTGMQNRKKNLISQRKRQKSLKEQQHTLQKAIFLQLQNQKQVHLTKIQNNVFQMQKEKLIQENKKFKEQLDRNEAFANQKLLAAQSAMEQKASQLQDALKQVKMIKRINQIDQKKIIHNMQKTLKAEQKRINQMLMVELINQKQRTKLIKNSK